MKRVWTAVEVYNKNLAVLLGMTTNYVIKKQYGNSSASVWIYHSRCQKHTLILKYFLKTSRYRERQTPTFVKNIIGNIICYSNNKNDAIVSVVKLFKFALLWAYNVKNLTKHNNEQT